MTDLTSVAREAAEAEGSKCVVDGCNLIQKCRSMCNPHYQRHRRHGDPLGGNASPPRSIEDVAAKFHDGYTVDENGCWVWGRSVTSTGYPQFSALGRHVVGHRWSYEQFVGPIPDDMLVCHKCDVKRCVNPDHLEVGSPRKNTQDAYDRGLMHHWMSRRTHCKNGHEFTVDNTKKYRGVRVCIACEKRRVVCEFCGKHLSRKAIRAHERSVHGLHG